MVLCSMSFLGWALRAWQRRYLQLRNLGKRKIPIKPLSAIYRDERVVESFEDIDLPKDMAMLVVIPEQEDEEEAGIGAPVLWDTDSSNR
jgi:hypothetical protein